MVNKKNKLVSNIHAHTKYCNHSNIEPRWLIENAISLGFKQYTISEHIPYPNRVGSRPDWDDFPEILKEFNILKNEYSNDDFKLFIAIETEYYIDDHNYYLDFFKKFNIDFMIYGNHMVGSCLNNKSIEYSKIKDKHEMIDLYLKQTIDGFNSKLFFHFAHPDNLINYLNDWDEYIEKRYVELIEHAIKNDITLGFNVNGLYNQMKNKKNEFMYPYKKFWDLVKNTNAKVRIEIDIHQKEMMDTNIINDAYDLAIEWGLKNNLVDLIHEKEIEKVNLIK